MKTFIFTGGSRSKRTNHALVAIEVVEHLPDHTTFFRECRRVLKPHGKMPLSTAPHVSTAKLLRKRQVNAATP